jgi:CTP synthase
MAKFIFITGGVVSSVGKGIVAASLGRILKGRGISVSIQKLDPYLNVDPGTMSPYQHGEVFVTKDGMETDLDLGHYERFIDTDLTSASCVTTGQVVSSVLQKERKGDFLGGTIQLIPHITNEIQQKIREAAKKSDAQVMVVEVGGTVGDIEGLPFLEAIRQMRKEGDTLYVHVTLLPYLSTTGELKTKPTQHSVNELRRIGIQPDIVALRSDFPVSSEVKEKVALFANVDSKAVIPLLTTPTIYEVPLTLEKEGVGDFITQKLGLPPNEANLGSWRDMVERMKAPKPKVHIAIVGKYTELHDAYISLKEALKHAALRHNLEADIIWGSSDDLLGESNILDCVQGIVVPGGFGTRGVEGMILAARYAREKGVPYLGICLGMQAMVIEYGRKILKTEEVNSTEFSPHTPYPVVSLLEEQKGVKNKGGTMRLGSYPCRLVKGTRAFEAYGAEMTYERHRHRFEFNNDFRFLFEKEGLIMSGLSPDGELTEIVELRDHPFMVGTQFHPEFRSRPASPHPLFMSFIHKAKNTPCKVESDAYISGQR